MTATQIIHPKQSVVFIDSSVPGYQSMVDNAQPGVKVYVLDPDQDGVRQMAAALAGAEGIDAIHVISHGAEGMLLLGKTSLTSDNLEQYSSELTDIGHALSPTGDILLYGCEVARGEAGSSFITQLSSLTGADVAASTDNTGSSLSRGNWILEQQTGSIESRSLVF